MSLWQDTRETLRLYAGLVYTGGLLDEALLIQRGLEAGAGTGSAIRRKLLKKARRVVKPRCLDWLSAGYVTSHSTYVKLLPGEGG